MQNASPSDGFALLAAIDPDAITASTVTTGWVSMADFRRISAIVMAGTLGAGATLDAKIEQASDASGTGVKDVTGKSITQLTQAGSDDSDKQAIIDLNVNDLDLPNGFNHVRLSMTVGTATSDAGAVVLGCGARYLPASDFDAASVAEVVK